MRTFFDIQDDAHGGGRGFRSRLAGEGGFTLIEALIATVVLVVGLMGVVGLLNVSVKASAQTRAREGATNLARQILEDARTIPYSQISPTSIVKELKKMNGLGTIESGYISGRESETQRPVTYAVKVEECAIDDPKDGLAKTHGGTFCTGQANGEGESTDSQPEDLKRISVEVKWTALGRAPAVKQVSTLTAAGQAIGLDATSLELTSPACPGSSCESTPTTPVVTADASRLTFSVSFPAATTAIRWSLEGSQQEELTLSEGATSATFAWPIDEPPLHPKVSDGTYQVSVQAVNATGVIGPPISIPVRLIRVVPSAPRSVQGGFNTVYVGGVAKKVVELQWQANTERNVIGYRVYNPSSQLACPSASTTLSTATSCIFFGSPTPAEGSYSVAALYRNAKNEVVEGPATSLSARLATSIAPQAPTKLVATKEASGSVALSWTAPAGGAAFYRIYRAAPGTGSPPSYTTRYDTSTSTTYTDTNVTSEHEYWVTAVSSTLTESSFLGPVSK